MFHDRFTNFINNADAKFDRSGNVVSIQEWINEPIFCFKDNADATTYDEVHTNMGANYAPSASQLLVVALYDETLRLTFDTEKIVSTELLF